MAPTAAPVLGLKRAPIDVYKKLSVLRSSTDFVVYEDSEGKLQRINDLGTHSEEAEVCDKHYRFFHICLILHTLNNIGLIFVICLVGSIAKAEYQTRHSNTNDNSIRLIFH